MVKVVVVVLSLAIAAIGAALVFGESNWAKGTRELRARLEAALAPALPQVVDFRELEGLPAPVQRYFRAVLIEGQPVVREVRIRHKGTFNMGEAQDRWKPFTSDQRVITRRPGFDWNARVELFPGIAVRVHDAYVAGEGILHAALLGAIPLVDLRGTGDVAEGEFMRFIAEAAWYPTALLPSQGVTWQEVDDRSALATLADNSIVITMLFTFDDKNLIETVRADARGRIVGKEIVPTPWLGRFSDYERRSGMLVPLEGEVAWLLPEGAKAYWRGRITEIEYKFAR